MFYIIIGGLVPGNSHFTGIVRFINRQAGRCIRNNSIPRGIIHLADIHLIIRSLTIHNQPKCRNLLTGIFRQIHSGSYPIVALVCGIGDIEFHNGFRAVFKDDTKFQGGIVIGSFLECDIHLGGFVHIQIRFV